MCGITGIVSLTGIENNDQLVIKRMTGCLSHRGPDNQEVWVDRGVSLGHARLKIIDLSEGGNNQRPDILLRNPRGFGRQVIIDVAITGIDGQSRTSDDFPDRPLRVRHEQKKAKYGPTADRYNLQFVPAIFSHTGQIHAPFKSFVMEQIRHKLITFEGKAKPSRVKAVMKWWTKCISMVIAKTASRNVAFKSDKIMDALFQGQSGAQTPQSVFDADFEILASNSEVYIFDQDDSQE